MPIIALVFMGIGGAGILTSVILFFSLSAWEDPLLERRMMGSLIIGLFLFNIGIAYWLVYLTGLVGQ
jgi:hypothetical protein